MNTSTLFPRAYQAGLAHGHLATLPMVWKCGEIICWGYDPEESIPERFKVVFAESYIRGYEAGLASVCPN